MNDDRQQDERQSPQNKWLKKCHLETEAIRVRSVRKSAIIFS
jgi:hypothetical protein